MAGIDKIRDQILKKAETEKDALILEAQENAARIQESAQEEIRSLTQEIREKTEVKLKDMESRSAAAAEQKTRLTLLRTRQEVITGLMEDAKNAVRNLAPDQYFKILLKLLSANVQKNDGEIRFSKKDLSLLTDDVKKQINAIAREKGGSLKIAQKPADIQDGFILVYGLIEENCSLDAVFQASKDDLTDLINSML